MRFLAELRRHGVTCFRTDRSTAAVVILGILLWATTLALYASGAYRRRDTLEGSVYVVLTVAHMVVGLLVGIDAVWIGGTAWPFQTLVIGIATAITFSLAALEGSAIARDDTTSTVLAGAALTTACVANAVMVSILFELFHRGIAPPPALPAPARMRRR